MKNIEYTVSADKKILTIKVDLTQSFGNSKSGKSKTIASSEGNKQVTDGVYMGLNVYEKIVAPAT